MISDSFLIGGNSIVKHHENSSEIDDKDALYYRDVPNNHQYSSVSMFDEDAQVEEHRENYARRFGVDFSFAPINKESQANHEVLAN